MFEYLMGGEIFFCVSNWQHFHAFPATRQMAKWTLHRLWARYQLLVGISALHANFADVCIIYGLPVRPCDGSTKPLIFLWPSQVALLFPGQGSQYVKMMGTVKDMPAVKEIWDCQLQLPIIQVRNAFVQNHVNVAFLVSIQRHWEFHSLCTTRQFLF